MSRLVEGLVRCGQPHNPMIAGFLSWESTTTAGIQMRHLAEYGVTLLIQMRNGSIALFQYVVHQHTTARKAIHWGPAIQEG